MGPYRISKGALAVSIVSGHPTDGSQWRGSTIWTSTSRLAAPSTMPGTFVASFHSKCAPGPSRKRCSQLGRSTTCAETWSGSLPSVSLSGMIRTFRDGPTQASIERCPEFCTRNRSGVSSPTATVDGITSDRARASRNCETTRRACSDRAAHPELQIAIDASAKAATDCVGRKQAASFMRMSQTSIGRLRSSGRAGLTCICIGRCVDPPDVRVHDRCCRCRLQAPVAGNLLEVRALTSRALPCHCGAADSRLRSRSGRAGRFRGCLYSCRPPDIV